MLAINRVVTKLSAEAPRATGLTGQIWLYPVLPEVDGPIGLGIDRQAEFVRRIGQDIQLVQAAKFIDAIDGGIGIGWLAGICSFTGILDSSSCPPQGQELRCAQAATRPPVTVSAQGALGDLVFALAVPGNTKG